mmetsp:Transcript_7667/g.11398  ORF Transcript_7667/g.11398 Transcript_7667/m.11398 type:complete len:112 (-) Transcript_7667:266-601(-)
MSGVLLHTIKAGDGVNFPQKGHTVRVHYEGRLEDGKKFDSSRDKGRIFSFRLGMGQVIEGWDIGVAQMSKGQIAKLTVPAMFGYGVEGYPPVIPRNATLTFEIELIDFSMA